MGKYPPSHLHEWWSDWHIKKCKSTAYMTDIDRLWVDTRNSKLIAVWDLKTPLEIENYEEPYSEKILRDFFEKNNVSYFVVQINTKDIPPVFILSRKGKTKKLNELGMINFIDNLMDEITNW